MRRRGKVLSMTALLVLSVLAPVLGGTGVAAASGFVSVSTTVGPDQPIAGQAFPLTATVSNAEDSSGTYVVRRMVVRDGDEVVTEESGELAVVRPGESLDEAIDLTMNETGTHDLALTVTLESPSGTTRTITQPVSVQVYEPHPQLDVSASPAVDGASRTVSVTVSNGLTEPVRQVAVEVHGDRVDLRKDRVVRARVGAGQSATFEFPATVAENGRRNVTATLSYTTADGDRRTVTRTLSTRFSPPTEPDEHPQLSVETESAVGGAWRSVNVTVANGLAKKVRQVSVSVASEDVTFSSERRVVAGMDSGATRTFAFSAKAPAGRHDVTVSMTYLTEQGVKQKVERTVTADFTPPSNPGRIRLTGVAVDRTPRGFEISGSASNVGSDDVESVIVEVVDRENVDPSQPNPEYFVGTVESSDFAPFDVNAQVAGDRSTVPVRITYLVDGVEKSFVTNVEIPGGASPQVRQAQSGGGGGGGLLSIGLVLLVVVLLGVLGVGYLGYRFVRG